MSTVDALLIATRAIHFGATMILFGEMLFAWFFAPREANSALTLGRRNGTSGSSEMRFFRAAVAAWACMVVSGACWFALVAVQMSGRSFEALDRATITAVLGSTIFGRTWVLRTVLALALAGMSPVLFAKTTPRPCALVAMVICGALLASLAWSGHANAQVGPDGVIHHLSDSIHLLAAGTWLGGLAPLAGLLRQVDALSNRRALANCAKTVTRFRECGRALRRAIVMTGIVRCLLSTSRLELPARDDLRETAASQDLRVLDHALGGRSESQAIDASIEPEQGRGYGEDSGCSVPPQECVYRASARRCSVIVRRSALTFVFSQESVMDSSWSRSGVPDTSSEFCGWSRLPAGQEPPVIRKPNVALGE
jgi:putative copper export protein